MSTLTPTQISVLIVSGDQTHQLLLQKKIKTVEGWTLAIHAAPTGEAALEMLRETTYDLVFIDDDKPSLDGLAVLSLVRQHFTKSAAVIVSPGGDTSSAVEAMKKGALDYLTHSEFKALDVNVLFGRLLEVRNITNQNMELRQINQMKNEFIANISHELRTPLQIIIGYARALETGSLGGLTEDQTKAVRSVVDRSENLLETINQIIRSRDGDARDEKLILKPVDLRSWVDGFSKKPHRGVTKKSMRLETALPSEEAWVLANAERLEEVMANLLSNAVKFGPEGSSIRIALQKTGEAAHISVKDEGPGVSPEMLPHIFEKFYMAKQGPVRAHPGLGLGLPLAKEIVELHSGRIWLESAGPEKIGTTAIVSLPLCRREAPERLVGQVEKAQKRKVLIVEDNPDLVEVLRLFMSSISLNLELEAVTSGFDALKSIEDRAPSLVILDVMMPGIDGIEVIRRMNLLPAGKSIPVLVLTGYMEAAQKAMRAGRPPRPTHDTPTCLRPPACRIFALQGLGMKAKLPPPKKPGLSTNIRYRMFVDNLPAD
ncbi:MAG: response regulator [Elusimicrobia bacterium]|nr:response regulator [Elusimicrobiota bacterium]